MSKVLITGAAGMLGSALQRALIGSPGVVALSHQALDVTSRQSVEDLFFADNPELVIHTAALTRVDECEEQEDRAFLVNALGAANVARAAARIGAEVVYVSTDYVFSGCQRVAHREYHRTEPVNTYGLSKLEGERLVRIHNPRHYIVRTAWLIASSGNNFVRTICRLAEERDELAVVDDQVGSPTSADGLARQILELAGSGLYGTYHATSHGECSWFDLAVRVSETLSLNAVIKPCSTAEAGRLAKRPFYSVLDNYYLRLLEMDVMEDWRAAVDRICAEMKEGRGSA